MDDQNKILEEFADRGYDEDRSLVDYSREGVVTTDEEKIL